MSNNGSVSRADHQKVVKELAHAKSWHRFCRLGNEQNTRELKENLAAARAGLTHGARKIIELHATRAARCEAELERNKKFWIETSDGWVSERNSLMEQVRRFSRLFNSAFEDARDCEDELRTCQQRLEECQQRLARARAPRIGAPAAGGTRRIRRRRKNKKRRRTRRR
jgi:hypothetical protein